MGKTVKRPPLTEEQRTLAADYVSMARRVSSRFGGRYPRYRDEFRSAAYLGLTEAAQSYRPESNVRFATFAIHRIIGEVRTVLRLLCPKGYRYKYREQLNILSLGLNAEWDCLAVTPPDMSRDEDLERLLRLIPKKHANICRLHYRDGLPFDRIGELTGVSGSRCAAIHGESLAILRHEFGSTVNI